MQTRKRWLRLLLLKQRRGEPREASHGESLLLLRRRQEAGEVPDGNECIMMGVGHGQRRRRSRHFMLLLAAEQRPLGRIQITEDVGAHPTNQAKLREEGRGKGVCDAAVWAWVAFRRHPWQRRDPMELAG